MVTPGKLNTLRITRQSTPGFYLDGGDLGEVLLPSRLAPSDVKVGSELTVFVYHDLDGRLLATTTRPLAMVGDFAVLQVKGYLRGAGVLLDLGIEDDLLLPQREQASPVRKGEPVVVFLHHDPASGRVIASSDIEQHLSTEPPDYAVGQPVELLIVRETPLGYLAVIEGAHLGLLYHQEWQDRLAPGQKVTGYIAAIRSDGKIDLSRESSGFHRVTTLTDQILEALRAGNGRLELDDDSPPEAIRSAFGASKKAFKQAVGALFRQRRIRLTQPGIELVR